MASAGLWPVSSWLVSVIGGNFEPWVHLAGFLSGLVPSEDSTGEKTDRGSITRTGGHGRLRSKLIQAAWSAIRQDGELREFYSSVCRRHPRHMGPRVAIVAVARKLSTRIAAVLMEQRALCDETKSSFSSFDPRGDIAPGNGSTTLRTGRKNNPRRFDPLRQRSRALCFREGRILSQCDGRVPCHA